MYVPWTGLGLFGGFRGNRWLRNRVKVFKQFVIPSLKAQSNKNFIVWCSWRPEEKRNKYVKELMAYMELIPDFKTIHTFHGVCFWDDKYSDYIARERLLLALHGSLAEMTNETSQADMILMTIQPSDDCYAKQVVDFMQMSFTNPEITYQAIGFSKGYMMNYLTKELAEYNPATNPPFFTICFPRDKFIDPLKHAEYTGPYKSHEYIGDKLKYGVVNERAFLVGTHGENISTTFVHPYKGEVVDERVLSEFGLFEAEPLQITTSIRRAILRRLPHKVQRKLRYWLGERIWQKGYEFLRG